MKWITWAPSICAVCAAGRCTHLSIENSVIFHLFHEFLEGGHLRLPNFTFWVARTAGERQLVACHSKLAFCMDQKHPFSSAKLIIFNANEIPCRPTSEFPIDAFQIAFASRSNPFFSLVDYFPSPVDFYLWPTISPGCRSMSKCTRLGIRIQRAAYYN